MRKRPKPPVTPTPSAIDGLTEKFEAQLMRDYGSPLLSGDLLRRALGYRSLESLRQAIKRGTVPVPVFPIENRRGKFALTRDVARWLAERCVAADLSIKNTERD